MLNQNVTNQSNFMKIFRGKTDILKQEPEPLVKTSYLNIEMTVAVIITHVEIRSTQTSFYWCTINVSLSPRTPTCLDEY